MRAHGPWAAAVLACALATYAITLGAPFLYDDFAYVVNNPRVREPSTAARAFFEAYPPDQPQLGLYRPVTVLSYALDAALGGLEPAGFHRTNVLLHAAVSVLVLALLARLELPRAATGIGALLFAVHPVHTEAVAWVAGRAELLAALGCLVSWLLHARFRRTGRWRWIAAAACGYFLALGSKETAVLFPLVLLCAERLALLEARGRARHLAPYAVALALHAAMRIAAVGALGVAGESHAFAGERLGTRLGLAVAALGEYLRLSVWPSGLRIDYTSVFRAGPAPGKVAAAVAVTALLALAAWKLRRRAAPLTLAVCWWFALLLPVTNLIVPIGTVLGERFLYLPSVAVSIAAACAVAAASRLHVRAVRAAAAACVGLALVAGVAAAIERNTTWRDAERFWRTALEQDPLNLKAALALHEVLRARGRPDEAEALLREAAARRRTLPTDRLSGEDVALVAAIADIEREHGRCADAVFLYDRVLAMLDQFEQLPDQQARRGAARAGRELCRSVPGSPLE